MEIVLGGSPSEKNLEKKREGHKCYEKDQNRKKFEEMRWKFEEKEGRAEYLGLDDVGGALRALELDVDETLAQHRRQTHFNHLSIIKLMEIETI